MLRWRRSDFSEYASSCTFSESIAFENKTNVFSEYECSFECKLISNCTHYEYLSNINICIFKKGIEKKENAVFTSNITYCGIIGNITWQRSDFSDYASSCTFLKSIAFKNKTDVVSEYDCSLYCYQYRNCTHYEYMSNKNLCIFKNGNETKEDAVLTSNISYCGIMGRMFNKKNLRLYFNFIYLIR